MAPPGAPPPADDADRQDWKLELADKRFAYRTLSLASGEKAKLKADIVAQLTQHDAAPAYSAACEELSWAPDDALLASMQAAAATRVAALDAAIDDARANAGDVEVRDALAAKAAYVCDTGDREMAAAIFAEADALTAGAGRKLDSAFALARAAMAAGDWRGARADLARAAELCEAGGDWERKNRLRVYQAAVHLATRDFAAAAALLIDAASTFTATELFSFEAVVFYAVASATPTLPRPELKAKVVDAPEVLAVTAADPALASFLADLHGCRYATFMAAFASVADRVASDRLLAPHARHWVREVRGVAYSQFLESYKSVTLEAMATAFGVSPEFVEAEVADLVASGRLDAQVDAVDGVVRARRGDERAGHYAAALRAGDALLNRLQALSKVADHE